ncbi:hypothetical protein PbJCM13498_12950 [Prolixibacter bellariivorans]|uniref:DUF58 domain-containing protein n=1 Tax=Prolixibacter bellariivorans TaxID=314319 RepID=A0A5M4AX08_9BACT|nr:DUF58 domain-containing protein [Prolixibacter bellariivorans]GET32432.1 hypothetical protein PbJCM13498_12950 [Prolixibacter bellariivorans]
MPFFIALPLKNLFDIEAFQQFDNLELIAREVVEGFITGLHRSPFHGFSVEFAEHRLYNTGESTKHIDWKLYARTERLFVKQYEEETNLRCQLVVDTSSSMLFPYRRRGKEVLKSKLAFSVYSAAALTYLMRRQRDAIGLSLFDEELNFHSEARLSSVHSDMIYGKLAELIHNGSPEINHGTGAADVLHRLAESMPKRSLVIIFSDMISGSAPDELFQALQHLRYNKHEVILFHVTDHQLEKELGYSNRPHRFVDIETGERINMNPADYRKMYRDAQEKTFTELKLRCGQFNIDLVEADIREDFHDVLWSYLVKRKKLF